MGKKAGDMEQEIQEEGTPLPAVEDQELDPDFEQALTAALALDATERIERLGQLAATLKEDLESSR